MIRYLDRITTLKTVGNAAAKTWILSAAILLSAAVPNIAQAKDSTAAATMACAKELKAQCNGVRVEGNNMLECFKKDEKKLSARCRALANNVVRRCDRDAARLCQGNVAGTGNIVDCLTIAQSSVSARCNAAIDAAHLRQ